MGWFWNFSSTSNDKSTTSNSISSSSTSNTSNEDAFKSLDPSLKDYLKSSTPRAPLPPPPTETKPKPTIPPPEATIEHAEPPHAQSSYGDRYADLWSSYKPGGERLTAFTPAEKMRDFVDDYTSLKAEVRDAAIENCAFEQLALYDCWRDGSWMKRMGMCRHENKELERCLEGQTAFLKALGYLTAARRDPDIEEMIQMHADKLYQLEKAQDKESEEQRKKILEGASQKRTDGIFKAIDRDLKELEESKKS